MSDHFITGRQPIEIRALFVGQRLNMRALEKSERVAGAPFVIRTGAEGYAVLFRYGVVVLFSLNAVEEAAFLKSIEDFIIDPYEQPEIEPGSLIIDKDQPEGPGRDHIILNDWDIDRLQMMADIFAKSAVLSHYERQMAGTFDRIEPIAAELQTGGPGRKRARELMKHIGSTLSIQRKMTGHAEIGEKPDMLWDRPDLERIFSRLEDEYELTERHHALKEKLDLIYKTSETLLGMLQDRRTLHVEWYIVFLILFDIIMHLGEKYLGL